MGIYLLRRLLLLPLTLACIAVVNFAILNLAPGDPVTVTEVTPEGVASRSATQGVTFNTNDRYLQFREHYGLTLPVFLNTWPWLSRNEVQQALQQLIDHKSSPNDPPYSLKEYDAKRVLLGDQARFVLDKLAAIAEDHALPLNMRRMAIIFFVRGGTLQAHIGPKITVEEKKENKRIARDNELLRSLLAMPQDTEDQMAQAAAAARSWLDSRRALFPLDLALGQKISAALLDTRFCRYFSRVFTLDFGTLRNDSNKTVVSEVAKRFKYSLTLSLIPLVLTFFLCQVLGLTMACYHGRSLDHFLNFLCLILYALPIFVVVPFLIEKVAFNRNFPGTAIPIPLSGFTSREEIYAAMTSGQRLLDIAEHICLPLVALLYGSLAAQARLARTSVLEVLRQDFVRTARAKGVPPLQLLVFHVGRNAAITIVTSVAGSLGVILGGSLVVETLFEIDGFGKFFYDAVINRDYNVVMFSALAGSLLSLLGYLLADFAYMWLDPRVNLEAKR